MGTMDGVRLRGRRRGLGFRSCWTCISTLPRRDWHDCDKRWELRTRISRRICAKEVENVMISLQRNWPAKVEGDLRDSACFVLTAP
jgi:hypothetical protein